MNYRKSNFLAALKTYEKDDARKRKVVDKKVVHINKQK